MEESYYCGSTGGGLFDKSDVEWPLNACLNFLPDMSYGYINGYSKAGSRLANWIILDNNSYGEIDYLIYPILFLFRHHLELRLKNLFSSIFLFLNKEKRHIGGHNLNKLWNQTYSLLKKVYVSKTDRQNLKITGELICEFNDIDPTAQEFRYDFMKDTKKSLASKKHINLVVFMKKMNGLVDFLYDLDFDLSCKLDLMKE